VLAPAHLTWIETDKKLNCIEYLQHSYMRTGDYLEAGIRIEELSSDEILSVVTELEGRLTHTWRSDSETECKQKEFWNLFRYGLDPKSIETENHKLEQDKLVTNQRRPTIGVQRYYHPEARMSSAFLQDNSIFLETNTS